VYFDPISDKKDGHFRDCVKEISGVYYIELAVINRRISLVYLVSKENTSMTNLFITAFIFKHGLRSTSWSINTA
jgi:hypothetical protein